MRNFIFLILLIAGGYFFLQTEGSQSHSIPLAESPVTTHKLPSPPTIIGTAPFPEITFTDLIELHTSKVASDYRQIRNASDFREVRLKAHSLIAETNAGSFNLGMVADLFDHVDKNWNYIPDAIDADEPAKASESAILLKGDCDDYAIYLGSLIWAVGGQIRIIYTKSADGGHAFAQVNLGQTNLDKVRQYLVARYGISESEVTVVRDRRGDFWLNLDYGKNHPGGPIENYRQATAFYPQGKFIESIP